MLVPRPRPHASTMDSAKAHLGPPSVHLSAIGMLGPGLPWASVLTEASLLPSPGTLLVSLDQGTAPLLKDAHGRESCWHLRTSGVFLSHSILSYINSVNRDWLSPAATCHSCADCLQSVIQFPQPRERTGPCVSATSYHFPVSPTNSAARGEQS